MSQFGNLRRRLRQIRARQLGVEAGDPADVPDSPNTPRFSSAFRVRDRSFSVTESIDTETATPDLFAPGFRADPLDPDLDRLLFFDLETTGLSYGTQIFMAGYLFWESGRLRLVQEVASDVAEERWLVASAIERLRERPRLVTFNGASFDVPLLKRRARFHALPALPELDHLDLLHRARRRYKAELPDCRLATLERAVIGKRRTKQDVPGAEAPIRFLEFVRTGDRAHIEPVLYHNRVDLTTLVALYPDLRTVDGKGGADSSGPDSTSLRGAKSSS